MIVHVTFVRKSGSSEVVFSGGIRNRDSVSGNCIVP